MELRFAKWEVSAQISFAVDGRNVDLMCGEQNGKQGEIKNLASANQAAMEQQASSGQQ